MRRTAVQRAGRMAVSREAGSALRSPLATRRSTPALTRQVHRWLLGALTALVAACPGVASAAAVTGPPIGVTPSTALVTATGAGSGARVAFGEATYDDATPASAVGDEFLLDGLQPATTYRYRVEVPDGAGGWVPGAERTVTTSPRNAPELVARPTASQSASSMI